MSEADPGSGEMRDEYQFSKSVRGKHYRAYRAGHLVRVHKRDGSVEQRFFQGATMPKATSMNRVFISHGHNQVAKLKLKDFVKERLGMEPMILAEQPDLGLTVVEKLERYGRECDFALILLTPDDQTVNGGARARQNVTHELGFFHGVLGRDRVLLLKQSGVELFSNISGLIYKEFERDAIESVFEEIRIALESCSAQRGGLTVPKEEPDDIKALLGSWSVTHSRDQTYVGIWTFLRDKTAFVKTARYTTKGEW